LIYRQYKQFYINFTLVLTMRLWLSIAQKKGAPE